MINNKNITETVSNVTRVAESIIDNMPVGSRFTTKEFVTQVVQETQVAVAIAAGVTALVVNNCDSVKPRAGRGGGIFKIASSGSVSSKNIAAVASALNMRDDSGNADMVEDMSDEGEAP